MVRFVRRKPSKQQLENRRTSYTVKGYKRWIDPFPNVHGTEPEKRVYAALSYRGIRFYFLNNVQIAIPEIDIFKKYQADFVLPDYKIIIEVQGAFWHSKPAVIESDAFKFALYQMMGYTVYAWWDLDIMRDINKLFANLPGVPVHYVNNMATELAPYDRTKVNSSKGIITQNRKRGQRLSYRKKPVTVKSRTKRKAQRSYKLNAPR